MNEIASSYDRLQAVVQLSKALMRRKKIRKSEVYHQIFKRHGVSRAQMDTMLSVLKDLNFFQEEQGKIYGSSWLEFDQACGDSACIMEWFQQGLL